MTTSSRNRQSGKRAQKRRQVQQRLIIGSLVAGALILIAIIVLSTGGSSGVDTASVTQAEARYAGLAQSITQSGATGYALGDDDAPVTIVEYADFSCPHCADMSEIMHRVIDAYVRSGDVRIVYKPVAFLDPQYSVNAAESAICAGEQGRFWEMHDLLWGIYINNSPAAFVPRTLSPLTSALELNANQYDSCRQSAETANILTATENELREVSLQAGLDSFGTPTILLNGMMIGYTGAETYYSRLSAEIDAAVGN